MDLSTYYDEIMKYLERFDLFNQSKFPLYKTYFTMARKSYESNATCSLNRSQKSQQMVDLAFYIY